VLAQMAHRGRTTFWAMLDPGADLSAFAATRDRRTRGRYVYERLRSRAAISQSALRSVLEAQGVRYRSFWIANALRVTCEESVVRRVAA
jgi:hypothetical protein